MWDVFTERTMSCVQILKVRVQCVVVDIHVNQRLQKKQFKVKCSCLKLNVSNQRVSVSVTTLSFQSLFVRRTLFCRMPFYVYPAHSDTSQE